MNMTQIPVTTPLYTRYHMDLAKVAYDLGDDLHAIRDYWVVRVRDSRCQSCGGSGWAPVATRDKRTGEYLRDEREVCGCVRVRAGDVRAGVCRLRERRANVSNKREPHLLLVVAYAFAAVAAYVLWRL